LAVGGRVAESLVTLLVTVARVVMVVAVMLVVVLVLLVLLAMRVFAWARRRGPVEPTAVTMSRMPQASTTHADQVRTRMVPSLSFQGMS
jgi:uncharacterized membrane protein YedE/YeeE